MNLFDVTHGWQGTGTTSDKPRSATATERNAYLRWLAEQRGIDISGCSFDDAGAYRGTGADCVYVLNMPGYGDTRRAILEVLDNAGNVVRSTPIAVDGRGRMVMTKAQVQDACGLKPVKVKRGKLAASAFASTNEGEKPEVVAPAPIAVAPEPAAMPEMAAQAPQEREELLAPCAVTGSEPDALGEAVEGLADHSGGATELTADPIAAIEARLAAIEAAVAALSVDSEAAPAPIVEARASRTAAHERAIRRAWAERRAARLQRSIAADHMRMRQQVQANLATVSRDLTTATTERDALQYCFDQVVVKYRAVKARRLAAGQRARRMIATAGANAKAARQDAAGARFELAKIRRDMADPSQPERASDIARLMRERDEARNANAALLARCERSERATADVADKFEAMVSRMARAEAALRAVVAA